MCERLIKIDSDILVLRDEMTQDCCSPLCDNWDECDALGYLEFMKIVIQDPRKELKDWCPSLSPQNPLNIEDE